MLTTWQAPGGSEELALSLGQPGAPRLLVLPAWFDEGNKTRHFTVETMRALERLGVASVLPDLPGCNESKAPLPAQDLGMWRAAAQAAATAFRCSHVLAIRAGANISPDLPGFAYAPLAGKSALRALLRARVVSAREAGRLETSDDLLATGVAGRLELAGYQLGAGMVADLAAAELSAGALVQMDPGGPSLWLRAEPDHDPAQATALAALVAEGMGSMTRSHFTCECEGEAIACTLDDAPGSSGLLIVSGGNETRAGAFSGQSRLAARIAAAGFPVLRFDRRGVGDSSGQNRGFRESREDITAALATFRERCPQVGRIVAFGNCDAASALMLMRGNGCDALVLSNPWTFEGEAENESALPPPEAIRARYWAKLRNPSEWLRLLRGEVNLSRLRQGIGAAAARPAGPTGLAQAMAMGLDAATKPYVILIAGNDRTGQAFDRFWATQGDLQQGAVLRCPGASHAYAEPHAAEWLEMQLTAMLQG